MKALFFKNIKRFVSAVALLALASCANITSNPEDSKSSASGEKIAVTFDFSSKSRTALPTVNLSEYKYKIQYKLHADSDYTTSSAFTGNSGISLSLTAGTYDFIVNAYDSSDTSFATPILTGSVDEKAISSSSKSVSVTLNAATGGTGTVKITLQVADNLSVSTIKAGLYDSISDDASTSTAQEIDSTTTSGYKTVTYTNSAVPSGVSKYVIFFLYDSSSNLIMPYVESVYVYPNGTSSSRHTINTEKFLATVTVQKNGMDWTDSWFTIEFVNAADSTDKTTVDPTSTSAIYTANLDNDKTYKVYAEGKDTELTVSKNSPDATYNLITNTYFPNLYEEEAYADTYLEIEFDSVPTINRASSGTVKIYEYVFDEETDSESWNLIDTIKPAAEKLYGYGVGGNSSYGEINAQYQLIQVIGNKVRIIPHHGSTYKTATLLENETGYSVVVDDGLITGTKDGKAFTGVALEEWEFITGEAPSVSNNTLTVGKGKQFVTVQGALNYLMKNSSSGDWTINIDTDTYYERLFYRGSANITMSGQGSADYGTDVEIQWANQDGGTKDASGNEVKSTLWNTGNRGRNVFYFAGGNLVLENLSIINTATRKSNEYGEYDSSVTSDNALGSNQAEALLFDSTGNCAAYNCNFTSKQDTVYLSPSGGKAWFYGCKISGDVDFIWGLSDVALFERCNIISAYDSDKSSNHATYVVASHLPNSSAPYGKGFVLYNSTITTESGQTTYLARSPWGSEGNVAQVAIIDTAVTGGLASSPWFGNHVGGSNETVLGWKWYGVTSDGSAIADTYKISQSQYEAEFAGRRNIINRVYNGSAFEKDTTTYWDISSLLTRWGIAECGSKETLSGESEVTSVVYDFTALTGYVAQTSLVSSASPTTGTGSDITLSSNWKWHGSTYGLCNSGSSPWTITVPITGACTITITNSYNVDATVSLPSSTTGPTTLVANSSKEYTYTGSAGTITFSFTSSGTFYISKIIVTYTSTSGGGNETTTWIYNPSNATAVSAVSSDTTSTDSTNSTSVTLITGAAITTTSATDSEGTAYSKALNFSDSGSSTSNAAKFSVTGNCTIYVVTRSTGDTARTLKLSNGSSALTDFSAVVKTSTPSVLSYSYTGNSTDMYLYSAGSGINVYLIKIVYGSGTSASTGVNTVSIVGNSSVTVGKTVTLTANVTGTPISDTYTWTITNDTGSVTYTNSTTKTLTLTGASAGTVSVKVSIDGKDATKSITVNSVGSKTISLSDTPVGYASKGTATWVTAPESSKIITVSNAADLRTYAKKGGYLIKVSGMIDMTTDDNNAANSMLPTSATDDNANLGAFISTHYGNWTGTRYSSWSAWRTAYAATINAYDADWSSSSSSSNNTGVNSMDGYEWQLYNDYKNKIMIRPASNTTIIGIDENSGVKGGSFYLENVSNIQIRNLTIRDAFDPFPHHEKNDGWNSQYDGITIKGSCDQIWIDHCSFEDTISVGWSSFATVTMKDGVEDASNHKNMWQTYDGMLDIAGTATNITISYCTFKNHDKVMLLGNNASDTGTKTITLHHCAFIDCVQRLPMVRMSSVHIFNTYYSFDNSDYSRTSTINVRDSAKVNSESNYFESNMVMSYTGSDGGTVYYHDDYGITSSTNKNIMTSQSSAIFEIPYSYTPDTAENVKTIVTEQAGAGYTLSSN